MQEEIKEILDRAKNLKYKCCEEIAPGTYVMKDGKQTDNLIEAIYIIEKLLDYITNLQEKVDQYENPEDMTLFYMWLDEKAKDKMKELQEENTKLKKLCDKYEEEHKTTFEEWKKDINIIDELEKFFKYEFDNEVRPLNSYKISVWTICLDKLNELKEK